MNVGIIGTGRHGSRYAGHIIRDVPGLNLTAISRRSPEGAAQAAQWGVRYHADWQDLVCDPVVDAVIAVTTPNLNGAIAAACIEEHKPLLVEKPLALNVGIAGEMVRQCREAEVPLTVGHTLRYNVTIKTLKELLPRAGELYSFRACHRLEQTSHSWLDDPEIAGAGVSLHTAVHVFDTLRHLTGQEVKRVRASIYHRHSTNLEDLLLAVIEMEDGLVGTVDVSKIGPARTGLFEFIGEDGQLQGDQVHGNIEFIHQTKIEYLHKTEPIPTLVPFLHDWQQYLTGQAANPVSGEDGFEAVRICEACLTSAREDRWVELPPAAM
ncbi:MAG: Gfo/Idh/MocA family oxidoreductase [Proteobacteria bacterium]|nr:Gfo/Idh/MocA family oxidoreductase [Pseudomonadota bacterium]MBU1638887.1 Gfo/Idh/MocA family oxidoreductase [Pseudomonadota bacterium]